jgi:hypothetical protein
MRTVLSAALLALAAATPARAADAVVLDCHFYDAPVCSVSGTRDGMVYVTATVNEPSGLTCLVGGAVSGTFSGAFEASFTMTRTGTVAVLTVSGDIDGVGTGTFVPQCAGAPRATFVIAGD